MRQRMSRRRSTVFAQNLTEELGFPEVKINKEQGIDLIDDLHLIL